MNEPHPDNAPGPFYVVKDCCTRCGVPQLCAPELFGLDADENCFVKRQPAGEGELDQMVLATWMAELSCIRYQGTEPDILRRLAELEREGLCDHPSTGEFRAVFRSYLALKFKSEVQLAQLARHFANFVMQSKKCQLTPIIQSESLAFFSLSWAEGHWHEVKLEATQVRDWDWILCHSPVEIVGSRGCSILCQEWLAQLPTLAGHRWFSRGEWEEGLPGSHVPY